MKVTEYSAFGWRVDKYTMESGEKYKAVVSEDMPTDSLANLTFYVAGKLISKTSTGFELAPKTPGFFNDNLPPVLPAMEVEFTAEGDVEWWCTNWILNKGKLPKLSKIIINKNELILFTKGTKLLICKGLLENSNASFASESVLDVESTDIELLAKEDTYCLKFES